MSVSTTRQPSTNLPAEPTSFIGRRNELSEVRRLLSDSRLVSVTGTGGVGKTRLAVRAAAQLLREHPDGVWLVELADVRDPGLVAQTVAAVFGLREQPGQPLLSILTGYLRTSRVLLILDNCEHVLHACATLAQQLLADCPHLRILATSRELLGVVGEAAAPLSPLSLPDPQRLPSPSALAVYEAVSLFVARGQERMPGFALTEDNHAAVAAICRQLDGLPLAIELAASWLRILPPAQILHRLTDRFRLLTRGMRNAPQRQQTLRAAVDWTFELCNPAERAVWARLAVFTGGFELDAAEHVCADDRLPADEVPDVVAALLDKGILVREEHRFGARYRMLETIRQYAAEKLHDSGDEPPLQRRHRDFYEQLVSRADAEWISPRQEYWLIRMGHEHPNVRAALQNSLDEAEIALRLLVTPWRIYWWAHGLISEGRRWAARVLALATEPTALHARGYLLASHLAVYQAQYDAGRAHLEHGRAMAQRTGDPTARSYAGFAAGMYAIYTGDLPGAIAALEQGLTVAADLPDVGWRLDLLMPLAVAYDLIGEKDRAIACHEEQLALTEPSGEIFHRSYALWALGFAVWQQGDLDRATRLECQALRFKRTVEDRLGMAFCLETLAAIAASRTRHDRAANLLGAADVLWQHTGTTPASAQHLAGFHDACERQTRDALGENAYQAAFHRGADLTLDEAVGYALEAQSGTAPTSTRRTTPLTRREQEVAELVRQGLTNIEIAEKLFVSRRTAESHVENILTKLGFTARAQIAAWLADGSMSTGTRTAGGPP